MTDRLVKTPIVTHPTPATTQDRLLTSAGRELDALTIPRADPTIAPPEYDARPTVASSTPTLPVVRAW